MIYTVWSCNKWLNLSVHESYPLQIKVTSLRRCDALCPAHVAWKRVTSVLAQVCSVKSAAKDRHTCRFIVRENQSKLTAQRTQSSWELLPCKSHRFPSTMRPECVLSGYTVLTDSGSWECKALSVWPPVEEQAKWEAIVVLTGGRYFVLGTVVLHESFLGEGSGHRTKDKSEYCVTLWNFLFHTLAQLPKRKSYWRGNYPKTKAKHYFEYMFDLLGCVTIDSFKHKLWENPK